MSIIIIFERRRKTSCKCIRVTNYNIYVIYFDYCSLLLDSDGHIAVTDFGLSKENLEDDKVIFNYHKHRNGGVTYRILIIWTPLQVKEF